LLFTTETHQSLSLAKETPVFRASVQPAGKNGLKEETPS